MCVCVCVTFGQWFIYILVTLQNISFETLSLPSFLLYKMTESSQIRLLSQDVPLFICGWVSLCVLWLWAWCGCLGGGLHGWLQCLCVHAAGPKSMPQPCHSAGHGMLCCVVQHHCSFFGSPRVSAVFPSPSLLSAETITIGHLLCG